MTQEESWKLIVLKEQEIMKTIWLLLYLLEFLACLMRRIAVIETIKKHPMLSTHLFGMSDYCAPATATVQHGVFYRTWKDLSV